MISESNSPPFSPSLLKREGETARRVSEWIPSGELSTEGGESELDFRRSATASLHSIFQK